MKRILQTFAILLVVGFLATPIQTMALNKAQRSEIEKRFWYDKTDCNTPKSDNPADGEDVFEGESNPEIAYNFLIGKGLNEAQAAGIVGNMQVEAGESVDPTATNANGATGIIQWKDGRRTALYAFATQNNADPLTLNIQLKFLWFEMNTTGTYENTQWVKFRAETDGLTGVEGAATAAAAFDRYIERCNCATTQRQNNARNIFNTYSGNAPAFGLEKSTGEADPCVSKAPTSGVGGLDVFPMENMTKTIIKAGVPGGIWCFGSTKNCHHDYNAADIHAPEGTVNIATKGGTVKRIKDITGGVGSRVTIKGEDGKFTYYYAHMAFGSLLVAEGDTVSTRQPLGKVGDSGQAMGTPPHLHFDMLPGDQYEFRVDCSGASCTPYPFVDVQPLLKTLYDGLPD